MTTYPPEPARKRYYLISENLLDTTGGYNFVNGAEALIGGRRWGRHEYTVPGSPHPKLIGVPPLRDKPKLVIHGGARRARDYYGEKPRFISNRAKELLDRLDPGGFEYAECDAVTRGGDQLEPYWMMEVIRWVNKFDEERSDFEWTRDRFPAAPDAQTNPSMFALYDIHMPQGFPTEYHAFWLAHYQNYAVFDEVLVDAWRTEGLSGATFTPLQPPTEADLETSSLFVNYPYWTEKAPVL